jgi:ribosomal protein S18 acetylase RimI-like enzyme
MLRIRSAEQRDIPALEKIVSRYWKVSTDHEHELKNPNAIFLVAEQTQEEVSGVSAVVGTALMWVTVWNKTGYLVELAVDKEQQRKGFGSQIVTELARRGKEKNLRAIIAETQPDNNLATNFYLKRGFRLCGYNDRYYTNNPTSSHDIAIFFSLDL